MAAPSRTIRFPKYRHYLPKNLAVVRIDGKDHYLGKFDSPQSWKKYHQLLADWQSGHEVIPVPQPDQTGFIGVSVVVEAYLNYAKTYYRRDGQLTREYGCLIYAFEPLIEHFGVSNANEFGPKSLKQYREKLLKRNLARPVINSCVSRVKRLFKWATAEELINSSIYHALFAVGGLTYGRSEARETDPVRPVADEHINATLPYLGSVVAAMVRVQRITGMRICEVTIMRPCDIDRSGEIWVYAPPVHKNMWRGHVRQVPLGPKAKEILKPFLNRRADAYLFSPAEAEEERNAERRRNRKSPMTPSQAARKLKVKPEREKR